VPAQAEAARDNVVALILNELPGFGSLRGDILRARRARKEAQCQGARYRQPDLLLVE
jgi:hypothetical protein